MMTLPCAYDRHAKCHRTVHLYEQPKSPRINGKPTLVGIVQCACGCHLPPLWTEPSPS